MKNGSTIIELLVVVAILVVLGTIIWQQKNPSAPEPVPVSTTTSFCQDGVLRDQSGSIIMLNGQPVKC